MLGPGERRQGLSEGTAAPRGAAVKVLSATSAVRAEACTSTSYNCGAGDWAVVRAAVPRALSGWVLLGEAVAASAVELPAAGAGDSVTLWPCACPSATGFSHDTAWAGGDNSPSEEGWWRRAAPSGPSLPPSAEGGGGGAPSARGREAGVRPKKGAVAVDDSSEGDVAARRVGEGLRVMAEDGGSGSGSGGAGCDASGIKAGCSGATDKAGAR